MDWLSGIMRVIDYIEDHLTEEIDVNTAAKEAACSGFYLQKLFSIIFGMTIVAEFFPSSGYVPTYEMDIEVYTRGDRRNADYRSEIRVPIKRK